MKILMVVPKYNLTNKASYNYMFPLGLGYISSSIKKAGYDLDCLNLNHLDGTTEQLIKERLDREKYDILCTGHTGIGYQAIKKIIDSARIHESRPKIILGGAIITSEPELIFNSLNPDIGVLGEGEITIVELLRGIEEKESLSKIKGIIFKDKDKQTIVTERREPIKDLDSLPYPDFEGLGFVELLNNQCTNDDYFYLNNYSDTPRVYPLLCSRGCPFHCTFCYHTLSEGYRTRSIKKVIEELRHSIKKYKINSIAIYDDLFSANKENLYLFCREIKKIIDQTPWAIKWTCQLSVINMDEEMLRTLKDSGCGVVSYGFESMSPTVLKSMKKPITPEQIDKAIKLSLKLGVSIQGNFIFGDVAETKETAYETLNYWKKNCQGQVNLGFIQPYPGSSIYYHCLKKEIIRDKLGFIKDIGLQNFFNMTDNMTDKEFKKLKKDVLKALIKYRKRVVPLSMKKLGENKYEVSVKCPFCKEIINYKNFLIKDKRYFACYMDCRNCNMRFVVTSPLKKFVYSYYPILQPLMSGYLKLYRNLMKQKI